MNAPARIRLDESARERDHRRVIAMHCPSGSEMDMAARVDIATIRDAASVGMRRATDSAAVILGEISRLATSAVYAPLPTSELIRIKSALDLAMMAARSIDRVTRNG